MRIAFFSETFLPVHDGVGHIVDDLSHALIRKGHEVTLYTTRNRGQPSEEVTPAGMRVHRLRSLPMPLYGQYRWAIFPLRLAFSPSFGRSADVVHLHTPYALGSAGLFAARHFRLPVVGTFHTDLLAMQVSFQGSVWARLAFPVGGFFSDGIYWRCDATTAPTAEAARSLMDRYTKPPHSPVVVVPNGVDTDRFRPDLDGSELRSGLGGGDRPLVTFVGRLTRDKGVHVLLDAFAMLPKDLPFLGVIGGAGVEEEALRARVASEKRLQGRVKVLGEVSEERKPALLAGSRIFVLPSIADTSSVSTLEAMASGCACIVTNRGGPRNLVDPDRNGLLVDPQDAKEIAGAMARLLRDEALARRIGQEGRRYVIDHASMDRAADTYLDLYRKIEPRP